MIPARLLPMLGKREEGLSFTGVAEANERIIYRPRTASGPARYSPQTSTGPARYRPKHPE